MQLVEFLRQDVLSLPKRSSPDYLSELETILHRFQDLVPQLQGQGRAADIVYKYRDRIADLCTCIIEVLTESVSGRRRAASTVFETGLNKVRSFVEALTSQDLEQQNIGTIYRARIAPFGARLNRSDMFHIPFERRYLVENRRYSFSGLPCLYLGGSTFLCWEELGRPDLDEMWFSAYKLRLGQTLQVFDLGWRPRQLEEFVPVAESRQDVAEFIAANCILWPLAAACSFCRHYPSGGFVVEYIVPQLLLEYVVNDNKLAGIRYFSTHIENYGLIRGGRNFVFPAKEPKKAGHCPRLMDVFELTNAVHWTVPTMVRGDFQRNLIDGSVELVVGHPTAYSDTDFARLEGMLDTELFASLH